MALSSGAMRSDCSALKGVVDINGEQQATVSMGVNSNDLDMYLC